jgi:hypothetical protein
MIDPLYNFIALFLLLPFLHSRFRKDISIDWMDMYLSGVYRLKEDRQYSRRNNNERQPNCIRKSHHSRPRLDQEATIHVCMLVPSQHTKYLSVHGDGWRSNA